jgi:hypothetical protein
MHQRGQSRRDPGGKLAGVDIVDHLCGAVVQHAAEK